jgi:hypothetical protein
LPQLPPRWPARAAKAAALLAGFTMLMGFETASHLDMRTITPLPRTFRLKVVEGTIKPSEARFSRDGNTYRNEEAGATGANLVSASWFEAYPTDGDAVVFQYPATDASGTTIYRVEYALESARNRYQLYQLNQARFKSALDALESKVHRNDANWREVRFFRDLARIEKANIQHYGERPNAQFYISGIEDLNILIDYSRRLPDGQKIITSDGNTVEVYVK